MVFSIFVMLTQVGLEAYILGTLFHYVVKKDAKLEEFRSAMFQCCCAIVSALPFVHCHGSVRHHLCCDHAWCIVCTIV